jgi:hypothetical protein
MARDFISYRDAEGTDWGVEVQLPGSSNAMIVFHHPGGRTARLDRYAWFIWNGPEARSVTSHIAADKVFSALTPEKLALLFRKSMPVSTEIPALDTAI